MNIKTILISGLFLILLQLVSNAQTDFRPGYVITNSNDTLFGEIDYRDEQIMKNVCKFRNDQNEIVSYTPQDIVAFRFIDSKYFISKKVGDEMFFLEYLVKGKLNLYYLKGNNSEHYYIDKEDEKLSEIPYEEGIRTVNNKRVFYETTKHIGFLQYYTKDAPDFQRKVNKIEKPEYGNLMKLAQDYHYAVCDNEECIVFENDEKKMKIDAEVVSGIMQFKYIYNNSSVIEANIYLWRQGVNEKLALKTGISYLSVKEDKEVLHFYKVPLQIQYMYSVYKIKPRFSFGPNIYLFPIPGFNELSHTIAINTGFNFEITKVINISANIYTDYTPVYYVIMPRNNNNFSLLSYSYNIGLYFDL